MAAYTTQYPVGVPGDIVYSLPSTVENAMLIAQSGVFPSAWGVPMALVAGGMRQYLAGDDADDFAGVLVRNAPALTGNLNQGLYNTAPNGNYVQGLLRRGYISVKCTVGTPARGGIVYIRVVAASGKAIGDWEATSDGGNSVALPVEIAAWAVDGKDADSNATLRVR